MPTWMTQRLAGLPRWGWVGIITTGVVMGLYLRHRRAAADATAGAPDTSTTDGSTGAGTSIYDSGDPSLAGAGFVAAPPAGMTPVESPVLPEGYAQGFTDLTGALSQAISSLEGIATDATEQKAAVAIAQGAPSTSTAPTGGGPPPPPPVKTNPPTMVGPPPVTNGYTRGLPGGMPSQMLAFFPTDHNLTEHKDMTNGKGYKDIALGAWNGSTWHIEHWRHHDNGTWTPIG